ncbi:MAG: ribonuclease P protein component 1 [archaeon]
MPRTAENLIGHELIGLKVEVVDSADKSRVGTSGTVVNETRNLLVVERKGKADGPSDAKAAAGGEEKIPKKGTLFRFHLPDDGKNARKKQEGKVDVEGWLIHGNPEERTKRMIKILRAWRLHRARPKE